MSFYKKLGDAVMAIVHLRVDDRLIHGQITSRWVNHVHANKVLVINDKAATDPIISAMVSLVPVAGIKALALKMDDAIKQIKNGEFDNDRLFLIVVNIKDLEEFLKGGIKLESANVGNCGGGKPRQHHLEKYVYVTDEEILILNEIHKQGVELTMQMLPDDARIDIIEYLKRKKLLK